MARGCWFEEEKRYVPAGLAAVQAVPFLGLRFWPHLPVSMPTAALQVEPML